MAETATTAGVMASLQRLADRFAAMAIERERKESGSDLTC
jgi:hypothetical protein